MIQKVMGVLSDPAYIRMLRNGEYIMSAEIMDSEAKSLGVSLIFFSYDEMDLFTEEAFVYTKSGDKWLKQKAQLPPVIYDHAFSCPDSIRRKLMNKKTLKFLNTKIGFWKWDTHLALCEFTEVYPYLPETCLFEEDEQLVKILETYGRAALKPVHGQKAIGLIIFIKEGNEISYQYRGKGKDRLQYFKGKVEKLDNIRDTFKVMGDEKYVVQQGLKLARYKGHVFDVRALMQKDGDGRWIASLCAKVGPEESEISALGSWARIESVQEYLIAVFGSHFNGISDRIQALSVTVAGAMDKAYGEAGEIALDIAVDTSGSIWLLEVNSMPAKSMFHELYNKEELYMLYALPVRYGNRLASENINTESLIFECNNMEEGASVHD